MCQPLTSVYCCCTIIAVNVEGRGWGARLVARIEARIESIPCQPECTNDCHPDGLRSHVPLHKGIQVVGVPVTQEGGALLVGVDDQRPPKFGEGPL